MIDHIKVKNGVKQTSVLGENKNLQNLNGGARKIDTFENTQVTEKKASASIWFAQNFPIHLKQLLPILQFLSKGNDMLQKMESLLAREVDLFEKLLLKVDLGGNWHNFSKFLPNESATSCCSWNKS